jgi:hypothetical protein
MAPTMTKPAASYVVPSHTTQPCRDCDMFRSPRGCTLVKGDISPDGHCKYFERRDEGDRNALDKS